MVPRGSGFKQASRSLKAAMSFATDAELGSITLPVKEFMQQQIGFNNFRLLFVAGALGTGLVGIDQYFNHRREDYLVGKIERIEQAQSDLKEDFKELKGELKEDFKELRNSTNNKLDKLEQAIISGFANSSRPK